MMRNMNSRKFFDWFKFYKDSFEYVFNKLHLESILSEIVLDNKKSITTIISLGMKISDIHEEDSQVLIITKVSNENKNE